SARRWWPHRRRGPRGGRRRSGGSAAPPQAATRPGPGPTRSGPAVGCAAPTTLTRVGGADVTDETTTPTAAVPPPVRSWTRTAVDRLLVVAGLCGLAVAQPLLELLGDSPSTFQYRGVTGAQIAWFAVGLVLLPPLVLWLVGVLADVVDRRAGRAVHVAPVAVLPFC